jgi:hypothetical protein
MDTLIIIRFNESNIGSLFSLLNFKREITNILFIPNRSLCNLKLNLQVKFPNYSKFHFYRIKILQLHTKMSTFKNREKDKDEVLNSLVNLKYLYTNTITR